MPSGRPIRRSKVCWSSVKNPNSGKPRRRPSLSKIRMTMLSPWLVGRHGSAVVRLPFKDLDRFLGQLPDGIGQAWIYRAASVGVVFAQRSLDVGFGSDLHREIHLQEMLEAIYGADVRRVSESNGKS